MKLLTGLVLLFLLGGCNGTPMQYHSEREIPEGPGLLSGPDGTFGHASGDNDNKM